MGQSQLISYWDLPRFLHDFKVDGHFTLYYPSITSSKHSSTSSTNSNAKKRKTVSTEVKMVVTSLSCKMLEAEGREILQHVYHVLGTADDSDDPDKECSSELA